MNLIDKKFIEYDIFKTLIKGIIKYDGELHKFNVVDRREQFWFIDDEELTIIDEEHRTKEKANTGLDIGDYYSFIISSEGMNGKKLYAGEYDNYFVVMAYDGDGYWNDTEIMILNKNNKL